MDRLRYLDLGDEEVDEMVLERLRRVRTLLEEIRDILRGIGGE